MTSFYKGIIWLLAAVSLSSTPAQAWRLQVAADIPKDQAELVQDDLENLGKMNLNIHDEQLNSLMGFRGEVRSWDLLRWLAARARVLVSENFSLNSHQPVQGVLQVGPGFFKMGRSQAAVAEKDTSFMRLSVLFHEARHNERAGMHGGSEHVLCPAGHTYENYRACDLTSQGAYAVEFRIGKALTQNCASCSVGQKEALTLYYLDALDRVIGTEAEAHGGAR